jgi:hypothetical protein
MAPIPSHSVRPRSELKQQRYGFCVERSVTQRFGSPDRRQGARGTPQGEPSRPELLARIVGAYRDLPGLCLTERQAARLFGLRILTCEAVLRDLVGLRELARDDEGLYRRVDVGSATNCRPIAWQ